MQLTFLGEVIYSQLLVGQPVGCGPQSIRLLPIPLTPARPTPHRRHLWCSRPRGEIPCSLSSGNQTVHVIYCRRTAGMCNAHPHSFITYFPDQTVSQPENAQQSLTAVLGKGLDHIIAHFTTFTLATVPPLGPCVSSVAGGITDHALG